MYSSACLYHERSPASFLWDRHLRYVRAISLWVRENSDIKGLKIVYMSWHSYRIQRVKDVVAFLSDKRCHGILIGYKGLKMSWHSYRI